jgi:acetoin utilization deacetylase AcuC-like enzyme
MPPSVLYFCDHYEIPLPEGHRFPMSKYRLTRDLLAVDNPADFRFECAPLAPREIVELAHDREYVGRFLDGTLPAQAIRRIGFPWSEGLVRRTFASVGGTLAAADEALRKGWGGNLAGGTHHAFRAEGSGFCVFNDIAVAILYLRYHRGVARAAVIDLDVHQGDGTASIFEHDTSVLTLSFHGRNNFPFRKQRSRIDVELEDGTGDEAYLARLETVLPQVFAFAPDVVFYQSGVDPLASDRLGKLALTTHGIARRNEMVIEAVRKYGVPLIVTMGGGYSEPVELTAQAHANVYRTASATFKNS